MGAIRNREASTPLAAARRTRSGRWVLRAVVSVHTVAIFGQPVFAGVYLSGDYDALRWHAAGANVVTSLGAAQLLASAVVWIRLRRAWPTTPSTCTSSDSASSRATAAPHSPTTRA
ncbi:hypothetical protein ACWC2T_13925 [Streptomyces sp. NPDC001393]